MERKVALVTGAGSGIGRASALSLARLQMRIGLLSRSLDELRELAEEIRSIGCEALVLTADISREDQVRKALEELEQRFERLDFLLANAGINGTWAPLEELSLEDWNTTLSINLTGTFLTIRHALPLLKRDGGSIVITSSVNGTRMFSNSGATAYACSKAAQVALAKMLAVELGPDQIRVNVICPGAIDTEIQDNTECEDLDEAGVEVEFPQGKIPLTRGRPGTATQVADLVRFLAGEHSSHISGTEIFIDGAQSLLQG